MSILSDISDFITLNGEDVQIYRRSSTSTDEFNRPKYTWALQATEKAFLRSFRTVVAAETVVYAGEIKDDYQIGFFKADSCVQEDDQVVCNGVRYDVKAVQPRRVGGATKLLVSVLRRMVK